MVGRSRRGPLAPEAAASIKLDAVAQRAGYGELSPVERAEIVAQLQEIAASWPHLLGQCAGILVGASRNTGVDKDRLLRSAQLLIEAGADLGQVLASRT